MIVQTHGIQAAHDSFSLCDCISPTAANSRNEVSHVRERHVTSTVRGVVWC
eukprot:m.992068 g.992068  ORF g.992068 m.992068 type:complete len:51 (-) comp24004_c0_seq3:2293-2445(-)